ncbi:MAG: hypothetical protein ACI9MR_001536 [Myxococcota bacterium]|jgi:hypothetical protein
MSCHATFVALVVVSVLVTGCRADNFDSDFESWGDDVYAPNANREQAHGIESAGVDDTGTWTAAALPLCAGDEDWFSLQASAGQRIVLSLTFVQEDGDLQLDLASDQGTVLMSSQSITNDEFVDWAVLADGAYYVRIYGAEPGTGNDYDLSVQRVGEACATDIYEPNDGYLNAAAVVDGDAGTGVSICVGDHEWYAVDVSNGELLEFAIAGDHNEVDLGLQIYALNDDDTVTERTGSNTLSDDEIVRYLPHDSGTFLVHVWPTRGTVTGSNDFNVEVSGDECVEDGFEPNNAYAEAQVIAAGGYGDMTLCVGEDDWYRVDVDNGQLFDATLGFTHDDNDLGLWLYKRNSDGTLPPRGASDTLSDEEAVSYRPLDGGTYVFRVGRTRGIGVASYGLDLAITGQLCADDAFEPNDAYPQAQPIDLGDYTDHSLCIGDTDWYVIEAENGQVIQVDASVDPDDSGLGLELYKRNDDGSISYRAGSDASVRHRGHPPPHLRRRHILRVCVPNQRHPPRHIRPVA